MVEHLPKNMAANITKIVSFGAGPRASQYLILGAKAKAAMEGRPSATINDVRAVAIPVLAHRVVTIPNAGISSEELVRDILNHIKN